MKAFEIGRALREAFRCPTCGKSRLFLNTAGYRRPAQIEPFDPEKHCACQPSSVQKQVQS